MGLRDVASGRIFLGRAESGTSAGVLRMQAVPRVRPLTGHQLNAHDIAAGGCDYPSKIGACASKTSRRPARMQKFGRWPYRWRPTDAGGDNKAADVALRTFEGDP